MSKNKKIAIIGAGIAGLSCANALRSVFDSITVFEKSVFAGGRLGSHLVGEFEFPHGANCFEARHPIFRHLLQGWIDHGLVREWSGWQVCLDQGEMVDMSGSGKLYRGVPMMRSLPQNMAEHCQVIYGQSIQELEAQAQAWNLFNQEGCYQGSFDAVVCATPVSQARELLQMGQKLNEQMHGVSMQPQWCVMLAFERPLAVPFDAAETERDDLQMIYRYRNLNPSQETLDRWVLFGGAEWSRMHNKHFRGQVETKLLEAFWQTLGLAPQPALMTSSFFWNEAVPEKPLAQNHLYDPELRLGACGDWCGGYGVESAVLSGLAIAERLSQELA